MKEMGFALLFSSDARAPRFGLAHGLANGFLAA
jgi:hypothetical protein